MPNIKSAMKRDEKSKLQNMKNRDAAVSTYKVAVQAVDRAAGKGLIHKNNAAHKKSAMAQKMNELG